MKVLLIDDNTEITDMVSFYLEAQGVTCSVANDGRNGLQTIVKEDFDVILMDLAMQGFSGFDIYEALKRDGAIAKKNILIFTASSVSNDHIDQMLQGGVKGIIRKPISIDELNETVEKYRR